SVVPPTAEHRPGGELALFMGVVTPRKQRDRWSYGIDRQPFLAVRPAVKGARGSWIKGNAEWHTLSALRGSTHAVTLLEELAGRHDLASPRYMYGTPEWLSLADVSSRGLWQLLMELQEAGVE